MNSPEFDQLVRAQSFIRRILWFSMTLSILVLLALVHLLPMFEGDAGVEPTPLRAAFGCVAIINGLVSLLLPRFMLSDERLRKELNTEFDPTRFQRADSPGIGNLNPDEQKLYGVVATSFIPFILRMALNESIALLGFVLSAVTKSPESLIPMALVALGLNLAAFPRLDALVARASRLLRTATPTTGSA